MNLTKDPVPQLIKQITIPSSVGFFFHTMYNVVDVYFAGLLSTDALAALSLSLSFPIYFVIIAIGSGMSQGNVALIANAIGENNESKVRDYIFQYLCHFT